MIKVYQHSPSARHISHFQTYDHECLRDEKERSQGLCYCTQNLPKLGASDGIYGIEIRRVLANVHLRDKRLGVLCSRMDGGSPEISKSQGWSISILRQTGFLRGKVLLMEAIAIDSITIFTEYTLGRAQIHRLSLGIIVTHIIVAQNTFDKSNYREIIGSILSRKELIDEKACLLLF